MARSSSRMACSRQHVYHLQGKPLYALIGKGLTFIGQLYYTSSVNTKDKPSRRPHPTFTEVARRAQLIECAIETIATLGYAQTSLAHIAKRAGMSKSMITYYFATKEELIEQVVKSITTAAASFMGPQIEAAPTATAKLQAYLRSNLAYIAAHRMQMAAIIDIVLNERTKDGQLRYHPGSEQPQLQALEAILRKGQAEGSFRAFDPRVMALSIRGAIDAVGRLLVAHPSLEGEPYAQELVTLFDRATRKE
jgi:TetR/AcrR family fatty acid metabolism transcriptional regulator